MSKVLHLKNTKKK